MNIRTKIFLVILSFGIAGLGFVALVHLLKDLFWFFPAIVCILFMWLIMVLGRNA